MAGINVNHRDTVTILNEGEYVPSKQQDKEDRLQLKVKLQNGEEKLASPNQTSMIEMVKAWGDDTADWVGQIVAVKIERQNVFGEEKDVIYLVPISQRKKKSATGGKEEWSKPMSTDREPSQKELDDTFGPEKK